MKKMKMPLVLLAAVFAVAGFSIAPALAACSKSNETITTGSACSIQDLNNLEKNTSVQEKLTTEPKREKDLRPIRLEGGMQKPQLDKCVLGTCIYKTLLGR